MQNMSSNNGTVQTPSYYLSAADADSLNGIFQQIADNIETGGSNSTLGEEAVIKDIVTEQFTLPSDAIIELETYKCTGIDTDGNYTWEDNNDSMGAQVVQSARNEHNVEVTGFDFSNNYVGTVTNNGSVSYRGNKLVIRFKVNVRDGFLGGNNVPTNGEKSGIYDGTGTNVRYFEVPTVDVPIPNITVTAQDKNVYLLGDLTKNQLTGWYDSYFW